jgi:hypothetical protein
MAGIRRLRGAEATVATGIAMAIVAFGLISCAGGQRQDANEPSGSFPVQAKASFPSQQLLANSEDLQMTIENVGTKTIPDLAVTIWTGKIKAGVTATGSGQGSFNIRLNDPNLSNPNRPVWVLNFGYPKLLEPGSSLKDIHKAPTAGAVAAQTDTYQFGAVAPGDRKDIVWRVTPVMAGKYPLQYTVSAGLEGKAKAVTRSGGPVEGQFAVDIAHKPPQTCVKGGRVVTHCD